MSLKNVGIRINRKLETNTMPEVFYEGWREIYENRTIRPIIQNKVIENGNINIIPRHKIIDSSKEVYYPCGRENKKVIKKEEFKSKNKSEYNHIKTTSPFVCAYNDVVVIGPTGLGMSLNKEVLGETIANPYRVDNKLSHAISQSVGKNGIWWNYNRFGSNTKINTSGINSSFDKASILIPLFNNYYHWTIDTLLKIRGIETYIQETGNKPALLIPDNMSSWMSESLILTGVNLDECVEWNKRESYISELIIPSCPEPTPSECHWLKNRMYDSVGIDSGEAMVKKRIYLSREDATRRRVRNENQLVAMLSEYGFDRYVLSNLSVADQVELFSEAEIILSPHGAGLTNIIYAPDEVTVIELFGERKKNTFYRIAEMLDYEYRHIDCDHDSIDIIADIDRIEREVQDIVNDR